MIMVTVMTLYPTADDRNKTYSFIQEGSIEEYRQSIPENFQIVIEQEKMLDAHTHQIVGHYTFGWQPTCIITIKELVNNECLLSDIYKCEDGKFAICITNKDDLKTDLTLNSNPRIRIKEVQLDYTDDDDGYDDYTVYVVKVIEGGE